MSKSVTHLKQRDIKQYYSEDLSLSMSVAEDPSVDKYRNQYVIEANFMHGDADGYEKRYIVFNMDQYIALKDCTKFLVHCLAKYPRGKGGYDDFHTCEGWFKWTERGRERLAASLEDDREQWEWFTEQYGDSASEEDTLEAIAKMGVDEARSIVEWNLPVFDWPLEDGEWVADIEDIVVYWYDARGVKYDVTITFE